MKKLILTLVMLLTTLVSNAQIGVITVKKNQNVPINMWYTIDEKDRENNLYITYDNEELAAFKIEEILGQYDMDVESYDDKDEYGNPYWTIDQDNGYNSDIYYIKEKDYDLFTITIVTY